MTCAETLSARHAVNEAHAIAAAMRREIVRVAAEEMSEAGTEMLWRFTHALCIILREQGGKRDRRTHIRAPPVEESMAALCALLERAEDDDVLAVYKHLRCGLMRVPRMMKPERDTEKAERV
jgi:hypothetical protein